MILSEENVRTLAKMDNQIVLNTYNLVSTSVPELKRKNGSLFIQSGEICEKISFLDECIFLTICEFTYVPLWYLYKTLKELDFYSNPLEKIKNWKKMNLIFIDQQTIGEFLRPTNFLYQILQMKRKKYEAIPFNMLSHTMSKMDIYLKSMSGIECEISDLLSEEFKTKEHLDSCVIEPIDILSVKESVNNEVLNLLEGKKIPKFMISNENVNLKVIDEKDIKIAKTNTEKISYIENKIKSQIKSGNLQTEELIDPSFFFCAISEGEGYILQFPDLIIPMKRDKNGKPNSIAVEMELTAKSLQNYERNLLKYKNSLKFGSVVWFCGESRVKKNLTEAYKNIGGTGFTSVYLYDYTPPKRKEIDI